MTPAFEASAPHPVHRGLGTEVWLLRGCAASERAPDEIVRAFALAPPAVVVSEPDGVLRELAAALAGGWGARSVGSAELSPSRPSETEAALAERAWPALEHALAEHGPARLFFVLPLEVLRALVARALTMPLERSDALCIDPGRLVHLRDDPIGWVLRRSNVLAPESNAGAALPGSANGAGETRSTPAQGSARDVGGAR